MLPHNMGPMTAYKAFPLQRPETSYLTEGGIETEIMYKWGFPLPHFAMFPLLDNPAAVEAIRGVYRRCLDVASRCRMSALIGSLDYRASPDWGALLGYSAASLADANLQCIAFLRELAAEYRADIPEILLQGSVGPRGDAYQLNRVMTAEEAEDYHSVQVTTLRKADVDLAWGFTLNNVPEAIGITRAAMKVGLPVAISFMVEGNARLKSGPNVAEAIETIDLATGSGPVFYTLNCSHPVEFEPGLAPGAWITRLRGLRPNASRKDKIELCQIGHLEEGDPVELGQLMGDLARRYPHMDIWGGCCGTGDVHLDQIATNVRAARHGRTGAVA